MAVSILINAHQDANENPHLKLLQYDAISLNNIHEPLSNPAISITSREPTRGPCVHITAILRLYKMVVCGKSYTFEYNIQTPPTQTHGLKVLKAQRFCIGLAKLDYWVFGFVFGQPKTLYLEQTTLGAWGQLPNFILLWILCAKYIHAPRRLSRNTQRLNVGLWSEATSLHNILEPTFSHCEVPEKSCSSPSYSAEGESPGRGQNFDLGCLGLASFPDQIQIRWK